MQVCNLLVYCDVAGYGLVDRGSVSSVSLSSVSVSSVSVSSSYPTFQTAA
jgi:hypothetical protein